MKIFKKIKKKLYLKFLTLFEAELLEHWYDDMFILVKNFKRRGYSPTLILDVGAYTGGWTSEIIKIYPNAKYIMFEAQPSKENSLKKLVQNNKNVSYYMGLLGSEIKKNIPFFLMETGSSVLSENTEHLREETLLDMTTIDTLLSKEQVNGSCLLKIDVQGFEIEVLKGASQTLKKVDLVLLEVSVLEYNEGSPLINDILQYMNEQGFITNDICSMQRTKKDFALFQVDIFFTKKDSILRQSNTF